MKRTLMWVGLVILALCGNLLSQDQAGRPLTREELLAKRAESKKVLEKSAKVTKEIVGEHPSQKSILDRSTILCDGTNWTFVPKGSVLYVPEHHKIKVECERKGKFLRFEDFYRKNRGWLRSFDVTLEQARGNQRIVDANQKAMSSSGRVAVATFKGGPVSVRLTPADQTKNTEVVVEN